MNINVKAPFEISKLVHPIMKQRGGGSIINISSIAGLTPDPGLGIYSVSKAALNMLTKVTAKEWGCDGIRVNSICPGLIKTKFSEALWQNEQVLNHFVKRLPIARMGTVDEIAGLALFLPLKPLVIAQEESTKPTEEQQYNSNGELVVCKRN
jgi:NAD(P)-dependent dehydrogenase (short-subunit alcohol dehydrogenase family)